MSECRAEAILPDYSGRFARVSCIKRFIFPVSADGRNMEIHFNNSRFLSNVAPLFDGDLNNGIKKMAAHQSRCVCQQLRPPLAQM